MGLGETITVINRSGKVVSSSKHIFGVLQEARSAYKERKAEIEAERRAAAREKKLRDGVKALQIEDDVRSRASSRHSKTSHRSKSHRHPRPPTERGYTDGYVDLPRRGSHPHRFEDDLAGDVQRMELARRHSEIPMHSSPLRQERRQSEPHIDMDLAYGDIPPPLPVRYYDDGELKEKASKLTMLLDEANCLQHSVTTMIDNLQNNPEALAAVALTLAEISTIVGKMGPGILTALKGSFPAVVALLASPQFMIAAGVGVGVTIVALGGFKIIKKIQQAQSPRAMEVPYQQDFYQQETYQQEPYQLDELETQELSRIEVWRRGIADVEAECSGTTVDGEFITPGASRHLVAAGVLDEDDLKSRRSTRVREDGDPHRSKSHRAKSVKSTKTSKSSASRSKSTKEGGSGDSKSKKKKEPSMLKGLFRAHTMH